MEFKHIPVLLESVLNGLEIKENGIYVDCTMGGGGHSGEILKRLKGGTLIGFDRDEDAVNVCREKFKDSENVKIFHSNYKNAPKILRENGINEIDGFLVDLGVSSYQIDNGERGFSILHDGKLDMRMDRSENLTAYDVVNSYSPQKLIEILYKYGEESNAKRIVQNIVAMREKKPIETTGELREIIEASFPKKVVFGKGGVSKKTFQAIRIEVNGELDGLDKFVKEMTLLLKKGGRGEVISFHSLEDRIVKNVFKILATDCICPPKIPICVCGHKADVKLVTHKPITASEEEQEQNPRSKSAKLRIVERI